jgi:carbamoyl-phosphate synthase/aspartate carbamoyltransferase
MVGYPESLTDPSYSGQILILTYPLVGSYGVPARDSPLNGAALPAYFESPKIHVAGLVISTYSGDGDDYSHHLASSELGVWLQEQGVPAIYGLDTRHLTKRIREHGVVLAKLLAKQADRASAARARGSRTGPSSSWRTSYVDVPLHDPNGDNLVALVSCKKPHLFTPSTFTGLPNAPPARLHPSGRPLRVIAIDVGMKYNQIRCFVLRGVELKVVPWDYDYLAASEEPFDGLFISNGPGDPTMVPETVLRLRKALELAAFPIFGICLGHQLLALAAGANTIKLKYGNRGANLPCTSLLSGRCYITSQNHGYAVDAPSLPPTWKELFVNANDGSNEGVYCTDRPYFSVQFHPESTPGPRDTEFLFDVFLDNVAACAEAGHLVPIVMPGGTLADNAAKNPRVTVRKVLVLGSGGLSIGQAGEFDYSGSQAIKALKQEGIYTGVLWLSPVALECLLPHTVLINPNIATIQTSKVRVRWSWRGSQLIRSTGPRRQGLLPSRHTRFRPQGHPARAARRHLRHLWRSDGPERRHQAQGRIRWPRRPRPRHPYRDHHHHRGPRALRPGDAPDRRTLRRLGLGCHHRRGRRRRDQDRLPRHRSRRLCPRWPRLRLRQGHARARRALHEGVRHEPAGLGREEHERVEGD